MKDDTKKQDEEKDPTVVKLEEELADAKNKYLRALADYQNLERQTKTWKEEFSKYASAGLASQLLEILDDLEKAQEHLQDKGLEIVINKLNKVLASEGLEKLELLNEEYSPLTAEVINTEPGDKDNVVIKILQNGYKIGDRVIRPAKVIVSTKSKS